MARNLKLLFLPVSLCWLTSINIFGSSLKAAQIIGADIYCVMRQGGNDHNSSWEASYQRVKNGKREGFFKTSPKQAAAIIVEQVVADPKKYGDCLSYLGDLYGPDGMPTLENNEEEITTETENDSERGRAKGDVIDPYSY